LKELFDDGLRLEPGFPTKVWQKLEEIARELGFDSPAEVSGSAIDSTGPGTVDAKVWDFVERLRRLNDAMRPHTGQAGMWGRP
jgi:hypothetical protein